MKLGAVIRLVRPWQWAKNAFVGLPMFFGGELGSGAAWGAAAVMFAAFSLSASAVYCLNDLCDVEADRLHPVKRHRPIASGDVPVWMVAVLLALLVGGAFAVCRLGLPACGAPWMAPWVVTLVYLALNTAYSLGLKRVAIVDVMVVALGFVLRVLGGGLACGVWVSPWIIMMTFLICLFLAFAKRRDDVVIHERDGVLVRRNVASYNLPFMNQVLGMLGAVTIVCYLIYSVSPQVEARFGTEYVYLSSVFVLAGILRYLQLSLVAGRSGSPTAILLGDRFIQACIACWLLLFAVIIYV